MKKITKIEIEHMRNKLKIYDDIKNMTDKEKSDFFKKDDKEEAKKYISTVVKSADD